MIIKCQRCNSKRVAGIGSKSSDCNSISINASPECLNHDGYVPRDMGIGGGDYIEFDYCLDCGQLQGEFPLPPTKLELDIDE